MKPIYTTLHFLKDMASQTNSLYQLLCKDIAGTWEPSQKQAFLELKQLVSSAPILTFYDISRPTVACADAMGRTWSCFDATP